jgi:hypothetical protein
MAPDTQGCRDNSRTRGRRPDNRSLLNHAPISWVSLPAAMAAGYLVCPRLGDSICVPWRLFVREARRRPHGFHNWPHCGSPPPIPRWAGRQFPGTPRTPEPTHEDVDGGRRLEEIILASPFVIVVASVVISWTVLGKTQYGLVVAVALSAIVYAVGHLALAKLTKN